MRTCLASRLSPRMPENWRMCGVSAALCMATIAHVLARLGLFSACGEDCADMGVPTACSHDLGKTLRTVCGHVGAVNRLVAVCMDMGVPHFLECPTKGVLSTHGGSIVGAISITAPTESAPLHTLINMSSTYFTADCK